jgi:hypothetical protein
MDMRRDRIGKDVEWSGHVLIWTTIPEFPWQDWGRLINISVRIASVLAEIQTGHFKILVRSASAWANLLNLNTLRTGTLNI